MESTIGLNTQILGRGRIQLGHRNKFNKRLKDYHGAYMHILSPYFHSRPLSFSGKVGFILNNDILGSCKC